MSPKLPQAAPLSPPPSKSSRYTPGDDKDDNGGGGGGRREPARGLPQSLTRTRPHSRAAACPPGSTDLDRAGTPHSKSPGGQRPRLLRCSHPGSRAQRPAVEPQRGGGGGGVARGAECRESPHLASLPPARSGRGSPPGGSLSHDLRARPLPRAPRWKGTLNRAVYRWHGVTCGRAGRLRRSRRGRTDRLGQAAAGGALCRALPRLRARAQTARTRG